MSLFSHLARAYMIDRLARGSRRGRRYGYGRRPRSRGGFFGPFPYYSGQTRRGSRVTVSGCCLPIPLGIVMLGAVGARAMTRR